MSELRAKREEIAKWATDHGIATDTETLIFIAQQLARQADVMERDVEGEQVPKDIETALDNQFIEICDVFINHIKGLGAELDKVITATYLNDMTRAKAIRGFQQKLANFEGLRWEE
jgi:hypothetical protein